VPAPQPAPRIVSSARRGTVSGIEPIHERPPGTGKGAVIGGVLGAVVGNQFGHGTGRAAMTAIGAAGGAVAGNNVERNINKRVVGYRVSVRLDNGESRSFEEPHLAGLRVGDRVRVEGRHLRRS
jgi:outer membrane lipoprotein SlyB